MFERFSGEARQMLAFAREEARALKHPQIGTEHLLLGLLREEEGPAARSLALLEVTADRVRAGVMHIVGLGSEGNPPEPIPFTPRGKAVLARASHEADERGDDHIGTEHLLLALAEEDESVAARVLGDLGADAARVRQALFGVLAPPPAAPAVREPVILDPRMFQQFGDRARQILILAQEEARLLKHNCIGTEHILLGLLRAGDGAAGRLLVALGLALEPVRAQVLRIVGAGEEVTPWQLPFTPGTKKALELAWREALALRNDKVRSEHVLLALAVETEGLAAHILREHGADPEQLRTQDLGLEPGPGAGP